MSSEDALRGALSLWFHAGIVLREHNERVETGATALRAKYANDQRLVRGVTFPATFETFLAKVVGGKTSADRHGRFRHFLRWNACVHWDKKTGETSFLADYREKTLDEIEEEMGGWKKMRFGPTEWMEATSAFEEYWRQQQAVNKSKAGRKGAMAKSSSCEET